MRISKRHKEKILRDLSQARMTTKQERELEKNLDIIREYHRQLSSKNVKRTEKK